MSQKKWQDYLDRITEKPALEKIYIRHGVAIDQLRRDPEVLGKITRAFQAVTDRQDVTPSSLLGYMINRRKRGDWVTLGSLAKPFSPWSETLSETDFVALLEFYQKMDETSDEYLQRPSLIDAVEKHFASKTGRLVPGSYLVAAMISKRKAGVWPKLRKSDWGFSDFG